MNKYIVVVVVVVVVVVIIINAIHFIAEDLNIHMHIFKNLILMRLIKYNNGEKLRSD